MLAGPLGGLAHALSNTATGFFSGTIALGSSTATVNRLAAAAVTTAAAEILPNQVVVGSSNTFKYHILPQIGPTDTGLNWVRITAPAGYALSGTPAVSVGGAGKPQNCPAPGAGQACATIAGQQITILLGDEVNDLTPDPRIQVTFDAVAPASPGSALFSSEIDDTTTVEVSQATLPGDANGTAGDSDILTVTAQGYAITSAVAEIAPNLISPGSPGNSFVYDILPQVGANDTGVNQARITAPAGFSNFSVTGVLRDGSGQTASASCPTPGINEYCASVSAPQITITLGSRITVSGTNLRILFAADAPAAPGSGDFTSEVNDTATPLVGFQSTASGDADFDPGDANSITVVVGNSNPVAQPDSFSLDENSPLQTLDVLADNGSGPDTDPDGDTLRITAVGATDNGGTAIINDNGTPADLTDDFIQYAPAAAFFGTETFSYTIEDGNGGSNSALVTVTVNPINDPPVLDPVGDRAVDELQALTFTATAMDPDLPANNLTFSLQGSPPAGSAITPTGDFSWTPSEAQGPGVYPVTIRVTDDGTPNLFDEETINITVNEVNIAPVLTPIGDRGVDELQALTFTATATDPDLPANTLSFSLQGSPPAGAAITPSGEFSWTPTEAQGPGVYPVTIRVSDDGSPGLFAEETINITVNEVNNPPVLTPIGDRTIDELSALNFSASATDSDGNNLSFSLQGSPPAGAVITATGDFSWTPSEAQGPGVYPVTVRVTDDGSPNLFDEETINITVNEVNNPPTLNPIGDRAVDELQALTFTATATDSDLPANSLSFSLQGSPPAGAAITATGDFSWTPSEAQGPGVYPVTIRVTDDGTPNLFAEETINITVNEVNTAPLVTNPGDQANGEGDAVSLSISAVDNDLPANLLTYSAAGLPSGLTINPGTGEISGTVGLTAAAGSPYAVTVTVTDNGAPVMQGQVVFQWTVTDTNQAPSLNPIGDRTVDELAPLTFTASGSDPDGNNLSFSLQGSPPAGAAITATGDFSWTPSEAQGPGVYPVTVRVTDDGTPNLFAEETINITVNEVNSSPVLNPIGDRSVDELSTLAFTPTATDADLPANNLIFTLQGSPPAGASITPTGDFSWTPGEAQGPGVYPVTVRVTDDGTPSLFAEETINITVNEVNSPPVLNPIGDRTVDELSALAFTAAATDPDLPANTLSFSLQGSPPAGAAITATGDFSWTPSEAQGPGVYPVTVRVTDNGTPNLFAEETINITVNEVSNPPTLNPIGDRSVNELQALSFSAIASDTDGNGLSFSLQGSPPAGAAITPAGVFSWTPSEAQGPGVYPVTVRVTDDSPSNLFTEETINITVNEVNSAPSLSPIGDHSVDELASLTFTATASDADLPANILTYSLQGSSPAGATITPTGDFTWTPSEAQGPGVYPVTIRVSDNGSPIRFAEETINITVNEVNAGPAPQDDAFEAAEGSRDNPLDVLGNDSDPDPGDTLVISAVGSPDRGGAVAVAPGGAGLVYTPVAGFLGSETFSYTVRDSSGATAAASVTVTVRERSAHPEYSSLTAVPTLVIADGVSASIVTASLHDAEHKAVSGKNISWSAAWESTAGAIAPLAVGSPANFAPSWGVSDLNGAVVASLTSTVPGVATVTGTNLTDGFELAARPLVIFTQGQVLELDKSSNRSEVLVGDVVTYSIALRNTVDRDVTAVRVDDKLPPNFKYVKGSTLVNGARAADPTGSRTLSFDIGTVPALADANGNGRADPGEPGYVTLSYQLVVGSGANTGDFVNRAVARDVCETCYLSNPAEARVRVAVDPLFDLGTIIGKVFEDHDGDGWQDPGEEGVPGAMVALDDGTYVLTDAYGRYHFPAVKPGQRLVKINLQSLAAGAEATQGETRVLSLTEGLLAKANFGVRYRYQSRSIGDQGETGLRLESEAYRRPLEVVGNTGGMTLLVNGEPLALPGNSVRMTLEDLDEVIDIKGGALAEPVRFDLGVDAGREVAGWRFVIMDGAGEPLRVFEGRGNPPPAIRWNGRTDAGKLVPGGSICQYQMEVRYADGSHTTSSRRLFGVNCSSAISLDLTGSAFISGSATLSPEARDALRKAAEVFKNYPDERIVIEGHTDWVGTDEYNLDLAKRRAEAAVAFLVEQGKLPRERFVVRWFGESRPIASNDMEEGRALNRRVEIKGEFQEVERARLHDQFRTEPQVRLNGREVEVTEGGRFAAQVNGEDLERLDVEMGDQQGRTSRVSFPVPTLEIVDPVGETRLAAGDLPQAPGQDPQQPLLQYRLVGRTEPGNQVELDGEPLQVGADGTFTGELPLRRGENPFAILVRNPAGVTRVGGVDLTLSEREADGKLVMLAKPVPSLTVKLPPAGGKLQTPVLTVSGTTDPGNSVLVNGLRVAVRPDGRFASTLELPDGKSTLKVEVSDPEGNRGAIEQALEVSDTRLFFLAFADGKVSQLKARGNLDNAGVDKSSQVVSDGRIALYLKGVIAGRYLITAALDTGQQKAENLFSDLDEVENDRLLTNLDPDKLYPVYGDDSTLVYDTQSQGKLYLALDSDELHLLLGNYAVNLSDTELAAYQRTLYGGHLVYQSPSRTRYGDPHTKVEAFAAEVRQAHIRDELRATGGSLYFLSQDPVIEGSEQVTLVVRDKNTGLVLARVPQQQNVDYTIKYDQGRILFHRPVASVHQDGRLVDRALLPGNPVFIQVDYETELESFEKTAFGGRVRQQLGDHLAVGGSYVQDELEAGSYELSGLDAEIRLGDGTRILGEYATSSGADALTRISEDGGLSYRSFAAGGDQDGSAWKTALEVDIGEWFGSPDRYQAGAYIKQLRPGFLSAGNFAEQGTEKYGAHLRLRLSGRDRLLARYDREQLEAGDPAALGEADTGTLQWEHDHGRWGVTGEYQVRQSREVSGRKLEDSQLAAARFRLDITERLTSWLEHQQTVKGPRNDQTTLGAEYQVNDLLALNASGTVGSEGNSAQGGASLAVGQGHIYLTQRLAEERAGRVRTTIVGGETPYGENTKVYSEYHWERSPDGYRNLSLFGAERRWDLFKGVRVLLSGEYGEIPGEPEDTRRYTVSGGVSYNPRDGLKISTRNEVRRERGGVERTQYLTTNHLEVRLNPDYTLLGKYRYSVTRDEELERVEARFTEASLGLAYRPVAHDRFNALLRYTYLRDRQAQNLLGDEREESQSHVASAEWSLDINRHLEWVDKEAIRIKKEKLGNRGSGETTTWLSIHRLNYHLLPKIDVGAEYRMLVQDEAQDQRQGWLIEVTWQMVQNFRLGVGYNFTDFSDDEFSDNDYSVEGWFVRAQGVY
ncbi:hypothetical protein DESUT3_28890 [Desulfuromonas versatilis]|uniref:Tandem-95 repeat protein n=2 Tax=Desulfuromonas versatilis TaxID=2802975 RepID=A0ABM8HXI1_9BACT|nr:hypothetical protein DESUT3_28890 [Desulfuromonas versatilis]